MSCDHACICTEWRPIAYPFHDTMVLTCVCGHTRSQHSPAAKRSYPLWTLTGMP